MCDSDNEDVIYLSSPSLKELLRSCEDLCDKLDVPYDPRKIYITTDYGTQLVVSYDKEQK